MKRNLAILLMLGTGLGGCARTSQATRAALGACCLTYTANGHEQKLPEALPPDAVALTLYAMPLERPATVLVAAFEGDKRTFVPKLPAQVIELKIGRPVRWTLERPRVETTVFVAFLADGSNESAAAQKLLKRWSLDRRLDGPPVRMLYQDLTQWYGERTFGIAQKGSGSINSGAAQPVTARGSNPEEAGRVPRAAARGELSGTPSEDALKKTEVVAFNWQTGADLVKYGDDQRGVVQYVISPAH